MDDPTGYETLYELLKALQRTSSETTDPEILAIRLLGRVQGGGARGGS